jgi:hypothetical protein
MIELSTGSEDPNGGNDRVIRSGSAQNHALDVFQSAM